MQAYYLAGWLKPRPTAAAVELNVQSACNQHNHRRWWSSVHHEISRALHHFCVSGWAWITRARKAFGEVRISSVFAMLDGHNTTLGRIGCAVDAYFVLVTNQKPPTTPSQTCLFFQNASIPSGQQLHALAPCSVSTSQAGEAHERNAARPNTCQRGRNPVAMLIRSNKGNIYTNGTVNQSVHPRSHWNQHG